MTIKDQLKQIYVDPIKDEADLYVGVELEFPLVNLTGVATDLAVSKALMRYLVDHCGFQVEREDQEGNPVQLFEPKSEDRILFEVSYTILEFAFAKARTIPQVEQRFQTYLTKIQAFLQEHGHQIQGWGIHPAWDKNDNQAVKLPRYQMLLDYLALSQTLPEGTCHDFPTYGSYICGNQVQLDVSKTNYLRVLNAFNQIEPAKAYLFPNSAFPGVDWDTTIARDIFWEDSMHGLIKENVGLYPTDFADQDSYLDFLAKTAMFTLIREGETYYFPPQRLETYLSQEELEVYDLEHKRHTLIPLPTDLATHRSYHYQTLTRRGTVEFRSVCTQPLELTFAPTAFHLGLLENLAELETYLAQADFFKAYGRNYPALRRQFSKKSLNQNEKNKIRNFSRKLLEIAEKGLKKREFSEEKYLKHLKISKNI